MNEETFSYVPAPLPKNPQVGMAYVPFQQFGTVYNAETALQNGTLFPQLDKPFLPNENEVRIR